MNPLHILRYLSFSAALASSVIGQDWTDEQLTKECEGFQSRDLTTQIEQVAKLLANQEQAFGAIVARIHGDHREYQLKVDRLLDELAARGGKIDLERFEAALGVPVVGVVGHRGRGLDRLREVLTRPNEWSTPAILPPEDRAERAGWADSIISHVIEERPTRHQLTERVDRIVRRVVMHGTLATLLVRLEAADVAAVQILAELEAT